MDPRSVAAHHEAAHAVVGVTSGLVLKSVRIDLDAGSRQWGGAAEFELPLEWFDVGWVSEDADERERVRNAMATAYAGSVFEREITGTKSAFYRRQQDSTIAGLLTGRLSGTLEGQMQEREASKERALDLVRQHRALIEIVAEAILERAILTGDDVAALLADE